MAKCKKGKTTDEAYQRIKNMMYNNELAPGQKLIYQDLAKKLNISITPVIQALNRLVYTNLVKYQPNKGYFVGEINKTEAKDLYQAREALETYLVSSVIQKIDSKKLNNIRKLYSIYNNNTEDHRLLILKDAQFHLKIAEFADNSVIFRLLNGIFEEICLKYRPEYLGDQRIKEAAQEHRRILNALEKRDAEELIAMIKRHIRKGMEHVILSLRKYKGIIL